MSILATAIFSLLSSTSPGVPVDVGRFDPADFPNLIKLERSLPHAEMTTRVEKIFADRRCSIDGQSKLRFDITIPYAILMEAEGNAKRVVVGEVDCAPLETLVGQVVVARAARGDFKLQHSEGDRWYVSDLHFGLGEPELAAAVEDPNQVTCKRGEPQLGSRLRYTRMCKTAAEWQAYNNDRQQLRRDIGNNAACLGNPSCTSD